MTQGSTRSKAAHERHGDKCSRPGSPRRSTQLSRSAVDDNYLSPMPGEVRLSTGLLPDRRPAVPGRGTHVQRWHATTTQFDTTKPQGTKRVVESSNGHEVAQPPRSRGDVRASGDAAGRHRPSGFVHGRSRLAAGDQGSQVGTRGSAGHRGTRRCARCKLVVRTSRADDRPARWGDSHPEPEQLRGWRRHICRRDRVRERCRMLRGWGLRPAGQRSDVPVARVGRTAVDVLGVPQATRRRAARSGVHRFEGRGNHLPGSDEMRGGRSVRSGPAFGARLGDLEWQ